MGMGDPYNQPTTRCSTAIFMACHPGQQKYRDIPQSTWQAINIKTSGIKLPGVFLLGQSGNK